MDIGPRMGSKFNMIIPAGPIAAIVGPSGAGESTLANLHCRSYGRKVGAVELDGTDLRHLGVEDVWRLVTDATCLF